MADATPSRLGQINLMGDALALFLKVFSGETLTAMKRSSAFRERHQTRTIASGKSAQFPVTGRIVPGYHTPGSEIVGDQIPHSERVINIEDLLIAAAFIANVDEMLNHYDVRSIYSGEIGDGLARVYDKDVARTMILAARAASTLAGLKTHAGFSNNASYDSDGAVLFAGIFDAGTQLDLDDIPMNDRYAYLKPVQYALTVRSEKPINRDLNPSDNGSLKSGNVEEINSIVIVKTNNLAQEDDRSNTTIPALRRADFSVTRGLIAHRSAAGTVQLQDVTTESGYDMRRQGTLMLGKYLVGHDILRPEAAFELRTGAPSV